MTFSNRTAGMAVDVQKLFDRYYTVETAQNSTGLGLSIAGGLPGRWAAGSALPVITAA